MKMCTNLKNLCNALVIFRRQDELVQILDIFWRGGVKTIFTFLKHQLYSPNLTAYDPDSSLNWTFISKIWGRGGNLRNYTARLQTITKDMLYKCFDQ